MNKASLQALPNELVDNILTNLDLHAASNLSKTCKRLRAISLANAYHSIVLEWKRKTEPDGTVLKSPPAHKLLRTLIETPEYVELVKSLEFRATGCLIHEQPSHVYFRYPPSDGIQKDEKDLFKDIIDNQRFDDPRHWRKALTKKDNDQSVFQMLLLASCTSLESLSVSVDFLMRSDWFRQLFNQVSLDLAAPTLTADRTLFGKLSCIRITGLSDGHIWGPNFRILRSGYLLLFYLPSLETLELTGFLYDRANTSSWRECKPSFRFPSDEDPEPPNAEKLTTLRLLRSSVTPIMIEQILKQTPNLHTFEYDCYQYTENAPLELSGIRQALQPVHSTLTHLTIRYEVYHNNEYGPPQEEANIVQGSLGPLHDFPALTSLSVSLAVLFGAEVVDEGRITKLSDVLPPHLQHLTITDDLWMYNRFQQRFEDLEAMEIFRTYLSGEKVADSWRQGSHYQPGVTNWDESMQYSRLVWETDREPEWRAATPELREFVYDLRAWGHRSLGYWKDKRAREELKRVCEGQGIECHVLFDDEGKGKYKDNDNENDGVEYNDRYESGEDDSEDNSEDDSDDDSEDYSEGYSEDDSYEDDSDDEEEYYKSI